MQRTVELAITFRTKLIGLAKQDIEHDRPGMLSGDAAHQLAMHRARPRPAAGRILHACKTKVIDIDDDDVRIRCQVLRLQAHKPVGQAVFQRRERVQPGQFNKRQ